jgi:hypothetical protein
VDLSKLFENLFQGNNWILILLGLFLFKDQLLSFLKPAQPPLVTPLPTPVPPTPVVPTPVVVVDDRPIIDAILKILPTILPVILPLVAKALKDSDSKADSKSDSK